MKRQTRILRFRRSLAADYRDFGFSKHASIINVHLKTESRDWTTTNHPVLSTSRQAILALQAAINLKAILDMRHKTSPSLASCDFPWTALLLLAVESLLPLTVVSCFACLASVSFTGLSSSGFLCVETDQDKGLKAELIAIFCTSTPIMQIRHRNHRRNWNQTPKPPWYTCHNYSRQHRPMARQSKLRESTTTAGRAGKIKSWRTGKGD